MEATKTIHLFNPLVIIVYSLKNTDNWSLSTVVALQKEESGCCKEVDVMGRAVIWRQK